MARNRLVIAAIVAVVVVAIVAVLVVVFVNRDGGSTAGGDESEVRIALAGEPSSFDVSIVEDGVMQSISRNIFEGLTGRTPSMEVIPELATEWEQTGPTTWVFTIRPDVVFHNGEKFDAAAAAYSINRVLDPANESSVKAFVPSIASVEATGDMTLQVELVGPDPNLPGVLSYVMMVPPDYVEEDVERFGREPVGTGPYVLEKWTPGTSLELARFDDYWGEAPEIDRATAVFLPEVEVRVASLQADEVNVAAINPAQADRAPRVTSVGSTDVAEFGFDAQPGTVLSDERLRLAINLAIDREALIDVVYDGYASPAHGQLVPPEAFGFDPSLDDYPFDLDQAKALVVEADAVGKEVVIVSPQGRWVQDVEAVQAIAAMIEETGLTVTVEPLEFSAFLDRVFDREARADLMFFAASSDTFDSSRTIGTLLLSPENGGTLSRFSVPEIDALLDKALKAETLEEKEATYHELWQLAQDRVAMFPLFGLQNIYGTSADLNWEARPDNRINVAEMSFG